MDYKIPFSGRAHQYTSEEEAVVIAALRDANPLTQGKYLRAFEEKFCSYAGVSKAFALCNATAALELSAQLCCFEPGDEILIPAHTFTASAYPFVKQGARPVWVDLELKTRVPTARMYADKITSKTRALVVVHLYGYAVEMSEIMELAQRHNLYVIEDAAQATGVFVDGKMAGTFGDFGVFSFHSHKNISTLGEGGMLVVRDDTMARLVPMLRHNGHADFNFERADYWIPAMGNVDLPELNGKTLFPNNYCLGEIECALGAKLLDRVDRINDQKRARALAFIDAMQDCPELQFHRVDSRRHNYHLLVAQLKDGLRDDFIRNMSRDKGIQCVVQYYPLYRYDFYKKSGFGSASCPNADLFFDNMVSFPFHHWLEDADLEYMIRSCREVLTQLRK